MTDVPTRKKRSISVPPDLDDEVAAAAAAAGTTYSGWIADAARKELTIQAGLAAVAAFEREEGELTPEERAEASAWVAQALERSARSGAPLSGSR